MAKKRIVCVVPTIRPESHAKFVAAWGELFRRHDVTLVTVWDGEIPLVQVSEGKIGTCPKVTGADLGLQPKHSHLFCRFTDACRNLGFVAAAQLDPDVVITADDDVYPIPEQHFPDPIQAHLDALEKRVPVSWMNTAHMNAEYLRGVPYGVRGENRVMLSHGVWTGTPDFDGETQLRLEASRAGVPYTLPYYVGPIPRGVYAPICFVPSAEVTLDNGTRKPISEVCVGDLVFAKDGAAHRVARVMKNDHQGEVISLVVSGRDREVVCTPNHQLLVLRGESTSPEWVQASDVAPGDRMATPRVTSGEVVDQPSISMCKLIGYFLAEGCYRKNSNNALFAPGVKTGFLFTFGTEKKADAIRDCCDALSALGIKHRLEHPKPTATVVCTNVCHDLVDLFRGVYQVGEWSHGKRLPRGVFGWDVASKRALLAAYWAGDGCFSTIYRPGWEQFQSQAKTRSRTMALQIQLLMQSLGFPASVSRLSPYKQSKESWAISINGVRAKEFQEFLAGGPLPENGRRKFDKAFCDDKFCYYAIKKVSRTLYDGPVYNLGVTDDSSYLVEGLAVKNCGMWLAVNREALPLLYFAPMGVDSGFPDLHRFADIFMGCAIRAAFDVRQWAMYTGASTILHSRASDAAKNFEQEKVGRRWLEEIHSTRDVSEENARYWRQYADKREEYRALVWGILEGQRK